MKYFKICLILFLLLFFIRTLNCTTLSDIYYPLEKDLSWVYQISVKAKFGVLGGTEKMIVTNFAARNLGGIKVVPQKIDLLGQSSFVFVAEDNNGILIFATQSADSIGPEIEKEPEYFIKHPILEGTTWETESKSLLLETEITLRVKNKIESINEIVTVSAGTFDRCLKIKAIGNTKKDLGRFTGVATITIEEYSWYAPGIGLVKSIRNEKSNHLMVGSGQLSAQLESYPDYKLKNIEINAETISKNYKPTQKMGGVYEKTEIKDKETLVDTEIPVQEYRRKSQKKNKFELNRLLEKAKDEITRSKNAFIRNDKKKWAEYLVSASKILKDVYSNAYDYEGVNQNDIIEIGICKGHLEKAREYFIHKNKPLSGYSEMKKAEKVLKNYLKENR